MSEIPNLLRGAEPQFYRGDSIGCLVTHGFMASPAEVGWLGQHLAKQGRTVYVPRLTGHGIDPTHMKRMRWQDWYGQALDGYHILRQQCEKVLLIGHSMGGLLSLLLASQHPVDALVVAATPITLNERTLSLRFVRVLQATMPYTMHPSEKELNEIITAEQEKRGEEITSRVHYAKWSTRAVREFAQLEKVVKPQLEKVTAPLFLLYAHQDGTGTIADAELIAKSVRSSKVEKYFLKDGAHIIFQDAGRDEAFRLVGEYVNRITSTD